MKFLINTIVLLIILYSCSDIKNKTKVNISNAQDNEISNKNSILEIQQSDSFERPVIKGPPIKLNFDRRRTIKMLDSIKGSAKQNTKKHKEIPPDGTYIYDIAYDEWQGRSMGEKVKVVIKGNFIEIISEGNPSLTAKKGETLDYGVLIKHNVTGDWLITDNPSDANLEAYGGCVGVASVIDFKNKEYHTC